MALLTISGEPASRYEEVAQAAARLMRFESISETRLGQLLIEEFGEAEIPDRAWRSAVASIVARLAAQHHLVVALPGSESLLPPTPGLLRAGIVASLARRAGNVMLDRRMERREAAAARCLTEQGFLSAAAEAELQFQTRLELARHGITPAGRANLKPVTFGH